MHIEIQRKLVSLFTRKLTFSVLTFLQVQNVDPSVPSGGKSSGPNGGRYTPLSETTPIRSLDFPPLGTLGSTFYTCNGFHLRHPGQSKKLKSLGPFWSYQLSSTANLAHFPRNLAKCAVLQVAPKWLTRF